ELFAVQRVGLRRAQYPLHRLRYRRLFRAWWRYTVIMDCREERQPAALLNPKRVPKGRVRRALWQWRMQRLFTVTGRELVRVTGDPREDCCVETLARQFNDLYDLRLTYKTRAIKRPPRVMSGPLP